MPLRFVFKGTDQVRGTDTQYVQQLETKQALARQLADLLHFTLKFDKQKMENAQLQNDYSFYRSVGVSRT